MTTRFKRTITPQAVDRDGVSTAQQRTGAGDLTITGAFAAGGVATFTTPAHVSIYSAGNLSGITFTVTGTDRYGSGLSEVVTGPNNETVTTVANFLTVTQVSSSGTVGTNVEVGSADSSETAWIPIDRRSITSVSVDLSASADLTYGLQYTFDAPFVGEANISGVFDDTTMTGETADTHVTLAMAISAVRLKITSYTTGSLVLTGGQTQD